MELPKLLDCNTSKEGRLYITKQCIINTGSSGSVSKPDSNTAISNACVDQWGHVVNDCLQITALVRQPNN